MARIDMSKGLPTSGVPRRAIPKPFKSPSISISPPEETKREWREVEVIKVRRGDTVANVGLIDFINHEYVGGIREVRLDNVLGNEFVFNWDSDLGDVPTVLAFVTKV